MLQYRKLGRTDLQVSSIGMGCVTFGREIDRRTSFDVLDRALDRGITLFDTAAVYGSGASETVLGEWIARRGVRERIVLATKVSGTLTAKHISTSAEASLRRLRTDRIDLLQTHSWDNRTPLEETLSALSTLVDTGKVRFIGCSNWSAPQLKQALRYVRQASWTRPESVQPPYNLVQRGIEAELLPLCLEREIGTISYSPLAAGFLTGKYRRGAEVPKGTRFDVAPGHQSIYFTDHGFAVLQRLESVAEQTGRSTVELALAWVMRQHGITSVLIGARNTAQVDQALDAAGMSRDPELQSVMEQLSQVP